ncbi:MAG TPA: Uma2 family endonuclease [Urbifossiella sp.]|nr:Uma2 family endonuclease [Urbifossiella sp.]
MATATSTAPVPTTPLMTAEEFLAHHVHERGVELVRGRLVRLPMPGGQHGEVCMSAGALIRDFVKRLGLGRVMSNDTFTRTHDEPASFRGADICFLSYSRLPKDQETPRGAVPSPDLVVEVRSPTDRVNTLIAKATEYVEAGVAVVLVLFPETQSASIIRLDRPPEALEAGAELTLPDVLPGFALPLRAFFE